MFRKHEMLKDYEQKYENNLLSLHINSAGTVFDKEIPCVKACFYFDPSHSLDSVVDSVSTKQSVAIRLLKGNFWLLNDIRSNLFVNRSKMKTQGRNGTRLLSQLKYWSKQSQGGCRL